jgi:mannose/fructose/N-acetylgalactosamine-specific phosphotransferase system component IID
MASRFENEHLPGTVARAVKLNHSAPCQRMNGMKNIFSVRPLLRRLYARAFSKQPLKNPTKQV